MGIKFANSAFATLASGINSSATSITLTTGQGARFPSLSASDYFFATLIDTSNNLEIVKCTARSTDVLTVTRAQESTTARAYSAGDRIELRITAQGLVDSAPVQSVAGKTGAVTLAASDIASGVFATTRLASSGTPDATTFLRGDQSWQSISQNVLTIANVESGSSFTGSTTFPRSSAAPVITDGNQLLQLNITTKSSSSYLLFLCEYHLNEPSNTGDNGIAALFKTGTTNAFAVWYQDLTAQASGTNWNSAFGQALIANSSIGAQTWTLRIGNNSGTINSLANVSYVNAGDYASLIKNRLLCMEVLL